MLRAFLPRARRDLTSALVTRLWNPVAHIIFPPSRFKHSRSSTSASPPESTRPAAPATSDIVNKESLFTNVLKEMMDSEAAPQSSENWPRPALPPLNEAEDLVFFQTEIRERPDAVDPGECMLMFGVTKAGNSVCIRITGYIPSSSNPGVGQFMQDTKIPSMAWIKIPATKYANISGPEKLSHCQLEVTVSCADVEPQLLEQDRVPPLRILSFDIECLGRDGIFVEPDVDPVIQIGNMVSTLGKPSSPFIRNIFTLDTCSPIAGAAVISCTEEAAMLQSWSDFVRQVDPDLVIGFNITGFDLPYLLTRAKALQVSRFPFLGRLKDVESARARTVQYATRGHMRSWEDIPIQGRLQLDLMQYARCEEAAPYLSLNAVAKRFLGEKKEDIHFTAISGLQTGSADTRRQLAVYCLKDAYLPQRLLEVLGCVDRYTKISHEQQTLFNSIAPDHVGPPQLACSSTEETPS